MPSKSTFRPLTIRVGIANPQSEIVLALERLEQPALVSANSLFDHKRLKFKPVPIQLLGGDVALDSAGFVAMSHYGRFPWSVSQYVELAMAAGFTWWSQLDCCCEPSIARDPAAVRSRIIATSQLLDLCRTEYFGHIEACPAFADSTEPPMPILQGWSPDDYAYSAELLDNVLHGKWPAMIGVGSVCRRHLNGPDGLWRVLHAIDRAIPAGVSLHLFGIKGPAIEGLKYHPRVVSVDSMAFEFQARIDARNAAVPKTNALRIATMERWLTRQTAPNRAHNAQSLLLV